MGFQPSFHILYSQCFRFLIIPATRKLSLKMEILIFSILKLMWTIHRMDLYSIWRVMVCNLIHRFLQIISSFINQFLEFNRFVKQTKLLKRIYLVKLSQHLLAILQGINLFNVSVQEKQDMKAEIASNALYVAFHIIYNVWKLRNLLLLERFAHYAY